MMDPFERKEGGSIRFSMKSFLAVASGILVLLSLKSINDSSSMMQLDSGTMSQKNMDVKATKNISKHDESIAKGSMKPSSAPTKGSKPPSLAPTKRSKPPSLAPVKRSEPPSPAPTKELSASNATEIVRPIKDAFKIQQIENYRVGKALLLNFHPTHHGGTSFCQAIGKTGGPIASPRYPDNFPAFACLGDRDHLVNGTAFDFHKGGHKRYTPVEYNKTGDYVRALRPHFHMTSWEYGHVNHMHGKLSRTNWEHPKFLSVVITRDPISRLLAGDGLMQNEYRGYDTGTLSHAGWWDYASNRENTDNFFLRQMEGTRYKSRIVPKPVKGENGFTYSDDNLPTIDRLRTFFDIEESNYHDAVSMLNRFTIVLDIACLSDGFEAMIDLLGLNSTVVNAELASMNKSRSKRGDHKKLSTRERIGYDDVYEYLLEQNQWDIKLYEYSKTISLVNCDEVARNKEK